MGVSRHREWSLDHSLPTSTKSDNLKLPSVYFSHFDSGFVRFTASRKEESFVEAFGELRAQPLCKCDHGW